MHCRPPSGHGEKVAGRSPRVGYCIGMENLPRPDQPASFDPAATGPYRPDQPDRPAAERFAPAALLAGRYRVVAALGRAVWARCTGPMTGAGDRDAGHPAV